MVLKNTLIALNTNSHEHPYKAHIKVLWLILYSIHVLSAFSPHIGT